VQAGFFGFSREQKFPSEPLRATLFSAPKNPRPVKIVSAPKQSPFLTVGTWKQFPFVFFPIILFFNHFIIAFCFFQYFPRRNREKFHKRY
jgi:hypothetical protein